MDFPNEFLTDFQAVYRGILAAKNVKPECAKVEVIDEETDGQSRFEPIGPLEILKQIADDLNFLTVYTNRPAYFREFADTMYEKNGLVSLILSKRRLFMQTAEKKQVTFLFDFEWQGSFYEKQINCGKYYIPIHKKVWQTAENLDIAVPIGYNTVIVKRQKKKRKVLREDRFERAFEQ